MATKKVTKKTLLNKNRLIILLVIVLLFLIFNCYGLLNFFIENKQNNEKKYVSVSSISYNVGVDDNKFIKETLLSSDRSYITSITKNIDFTFKYDLTSEISLPINYQYGIKATLYGLYNEDPTSENNPVLWNKEYVIKEDTGIVSSNNSTLSLTETFSIDVRKYITEIMDFVEYFQIPTISYIKIEMPITIYGDDGTYSLSKKYVLSAKIDVEDKVFFVNQSENIEDNGYLLLENKKLSEIKITIIGIYVVGFIFSLVMSLLIVKKLQEYKELINYEEKLDKIKSDYSEILVLTNSMIDTKKLKVISIISFEELLNLAANLSSPIMEFEDTKETSFYVIKDEIVYLFVLKKKDYNKKQGTKNS
ncbi:MAG: DUF5305 family protein [Bacilli bacterium]|nr:DUF5305 family protein [Bacilli bacterium]